MPKPGSNREKNLAAKKKQMKKVGRSVFLLLELSMKPKKKKGKK